MNHLALLRGNAISREIEDAEEEARRFLGTVGRLRNRLLKDERIRQYGHITGCRETAAVRRASLDLSRALSAMRKS